MFGPMNYVRRTRIMPALSKLESNQWKSQKECAAVSWTNVKAVLHHAYNSVPYYRNLWKSLQISPEDIRLPKDLLKIPVLTKNDIRANFSNMRSTVPRIGVFSNSTGGSTGQPVKLLQDQEVVTYAFASQIRSQRAMGWDIGEKSAYIWGAERDSPHAKIQNRVGLIFLRGVWLNAFRMTENRMRSFARILEQHEPKIIIGYASSLHLMARYLLRESIELPHIAGIQSSAESLFGTQRRDIEKAFKCRVFDKYGSREFGTIAHECKSHSGLHINSDIQHLEFERDGEEVGGNESGRILVTSLTNFVMPLIRYDIDDVSSSIGYECSCGRGLPLMEPVKGRTSDIITTPNGNLVHGEYFTHLFYNLDGVKEFQVEQISRSKLVVRVVIEPAKFKHDAFDKMQLEIHRFIDKDLEMEFQVVDEIPLTRTGKHRFTLSQVASPM
jgi:phenylacetate-CoA ligase